MMQLPARIGKYELQEFLGGGMSHVFRAQDTVIGRTVAVKILTEQGCQDSEVKARFLAEARMAGNLHHDNILGIYDFGADDQNRPFMVMEYLRGEDLRHAIKDNHTGDLKGKLKIAVQIARALEYVHTQKIVHRDIKPENIHINTAGVAKLMDFGISKTEGLSMTRAGYVLGTPYYMAPEQVTGQDVTDQVDVYSFGILMFELFTGNKPITGDSVERIFYSILNEPLKVEPLVEAGVSQPVIDLVTACTQKNPPDRPHGFIPVCAELDRLIAEMEAPPPLPVVTPPPPRPAWVLPAVIAAVLAVLGGGYIAMKPKALPPTLTLPSGDMVLVPAGNFLYGEKKEPVTLPAFYIDKTEVTNKSYASFCVDTNHPLPEGFDKNLADYPVTNISILDAKDYADWAHKRLPTAKQWEKAARGVDGRTFPWGNENDASRANLGGPEGKLQPASAMPNSASPFGAINMVGNVNELVYELSTPSQRMQDYFATLLKPPPGPGDSWYMIRGGSYNAKLDDNLIWDSTTVPARWKDTNIGFRCVKDPQ